MSPIDPYRSWGDIHEENLRIMNPQGNTSADYAEIQSKAATATKLTTRM
jgi:hypothetical protein